MMNREMLYDAITQVKDELVIEAMETVPKKKKVHWLKFGSIAAAVALAVGLGAGVLSGKIPWIPIGGMVGGEGHNSDNRSVFMYYAGPVFPLTTAEGGDGLAVGREITFDFQAWENGTWPYTDLPVTDAYTLTNPTGEDKTVTLRYPFVSSLYGLSDYQPTLTADGTELETDLLTGRYSQLDGGRSGGLPSLSSPGSWVAYRDLLSDGRYQAGPLDSWPDLSDIPVTVYEITNPWIDAEAREDGFKGENYNPTLHASMRLDYGRTTVLSYGFNSGSFDRENGIMRQGFTFPRPWSDPDIYERDRAEIHYLIVIGEPLDSFELIGTWDGDPKSTGYMEWGVQANADCRQYGTDLDSALRTVAKKAYGGRGWEDRDDNVNRADFELYFGMMKDCLLDTGLLLEDAEDRYDFCVLEDLLYFDSIDRVFYLQAPVTIPAGGSVTVKASLLKKASLDYACTNTKNEGIYGYDMVTKLGSNLDFTAQTAKAVNTDGVEIVRQNFGFDWKNGVDTVTLDPAVEYYFLEVRRMNRK